MKVRFNRGALADLGEILSYIAERNPQAAAALLERFEGASRLIGKSPEIGMQTEKANFRTFIVGFYLMVYEIVTDEIIIHYVRHGARQRPWEGE